MIREHPPADGQIRERKTAAAARPTSPGLRTLT
jgi:hypothetical protein